MTTNPQSAIRNSDSAYTQLNISPTANRREFAVTFIQAGRVKNRDQTPAAWEIPNTVLAQAVPLFNGKAVFLDHTGEGHLPSLRNMVAVTADAHYDDHTGRVNGIIRLYDRQDTAWVQQMLDQIITDQQAGRETPDVGLSITFFGHHTPTEKRGDPIRRTDAITHIESCDLVFGPAASGRVLQALSTQRTDPLDDLRATLSSLRPFSAARVSERSPSQQGDQPVTEQRAPYTTTPPADTTPPATPATLATTETPPAAAPPTIDITQVLTHLDALNNRIETLAAATATLVENQIIRGMGTPPVTLTAPPTRHAPVVTQMWSSLDRIQAAYEYLMGLPARGDFERLTGIRELYMTLTGDRALTGRFSPQWRALAYNPDGNNADTTSMAEITRNVMNKVMIQQVDLLTEYRWWEKVAHIQDFASLQQVSWMRLGGIGDIPTVAEKAEYTQLLWDDARVAADWVKKGGYLPLSLEMIDRDDVEAWRTVPIQLATSAYVTLSSIVSALFTDNSGIGPSITTEGSTAYAFSSTWGNLINQPLTYENWQTAIETMYSLAQFNVATRPIALRPKFLLVPVELESQAISVVTSDRRPGTDYNDRVPVKRMLPEDNVITVPNWTDAENWAALADPNLCPFIGIGFRYGRTPELFTASDPNSHLLFTNDVLPIKVRWFFAVSVIDPRGAIKSNA